jgi:hypothetical protein
MVAVAREPWMVGCDGAWRDGLGGSFLCFPGRAVTGGDRQRHAHDDAGHRLPSRNPYAFAHCYRDSDRDGHANSYEHGYRHRDGYSHSHADGHAQPHATSYQNTQANADTNAYEYTDVDAD